VEVVVDGVLPPLALMVHQVAAADVQQQDLRPVLVA
jgi:hypothetical protein